MTISVQYPFDTDTNYNYDNTKIEISGGVAKLVASVIPGAAYTYLKLDENQGVVAIDSSGNGRHGAFQGGLDITAWTTGIIDYAIEGNGSGWISLNDFGDFDGSSAFSIECWFKFTSTLSQQIWGKQINSGQFQGYAINVSAGKIRSIFRDDNGKRQGREVVTTDNDGNWHHIVATYDGTKLNSGFKLYVDNVLITNSIFTDDLTGSMSNTASLQISGRDGSNNAMQPGSVADMCVIYSRELTSAEVAFRWNSGNATTVLPGTGTSFPIDNPTISPKSTIRMSDINSFSSNIIATGSDEIRGVITEGGQDKYWNGSIWADSSNYNETNTISDINTNLSSLVITGSSLIGYKLYLHSDDGSTTPEVEDVDLTYDLNVTIEENECIVFGTITDVSVDVESAVIRGYLDKPFFRSNNLISVDKTVQTDIDGFFEISLIETETTGDKLNIDIDYTLVDGTQKKKTYRDLIIPNKITESLENIVEA